MGANREALQRYALAVISHLLLIAAWHFFVVVGKVPNFVLPSPLATLNALLIPNYRWLENIAVTGIEIFGGYVLAVVIGIAIALLFSWSRWLEMIAMPLLVSLNMIPKVALGPLIIVWFKYGIGPNIMMAFAEGMVLATKGGIDPSLMLEILDNSAAKSGLISFKAPFILARDFQTNFATKWMHKDVGLALESARSMDVPLPATALTQQMLQAAIARGWGDDDFCSAIRVLEEWSGVEVKKQA